MNVKQFLLGLFRGQSMNGELQQVRDAARQDADLIVGTYLSEFESRTSQLLTERQQRFIGFKEEPEEIDAEYEVDYSGLTRPELMRLAKSQGLEYSRSSTREDLIGLLSSPA